MGRPSKYQPEYCEMLVSHMEQGYSFEAFAALVSVDKVTLYSWAEKNPEFLYAKNIGTEKCRYFWERLGIAGASGLLETFSVGCWIFNMKNRFRAEWQDKIELPISSESVIKIAYDHSKPLLSKEAANVIDIESEDVPSKSTTKNKVEGKRRVSPRPL